MSKIQSAPNSPGFLHSFAKAIRIFAIAAAALLLVRAADGQQLRVAAASDLQFAMADLVASYQARTKSTLAVTYGSSGNFFTQIENGAPFDMFFSADIEYPQKLVDAGLAERQTLYSYAFGRLALWAPPESHLDLTKNTFAVLLDPQVKKIAIANPEHAPYGRAAVESLQKTGIYVQVKAKLVFGENISQAAQFVQTGNAQLGFIALSLAISPSMKNGDRWLIPEYFHLPLEQAAVVISSSKNKAAATSFLDYVKSSEGKAILARYGFTASQTPPGGKQP